MVYVGTVADHAADAEITFYKRRQVSENLLLRAERFPLWKGYSYPPRYPAERVGRVLQVPDDNGKGRTAARRYPQKRWSHADWHIQTGYRRCDGLRSLLFPATLI